jgi:hypothetical protein
LMTLNNRFIEIKVNGSNSESLQTLANFLD